MRILGVQETLPQLHKYIYAAVWLPDALLFKVYLYHGLKMLLF